MERGSAERIVASLRGDRIVFRYFKDRYAIQLLAYAAAEGQSLSEMRRGRFRPLLQKPLIRRILGERGGRGANWDLLDSYFIEPTEDYELTFDVWGDDRDDSAWWQTSRRGTNVVLQLNFPATHDRAYRRYIGPTGEGPFVWSCHPVHRGGRHTLAWARLDIDFESGEALIEEIQSDWVRDAEYWRAAALETMVDGTWDLDLVDARCDPVQLFRYVEHVLSPHRRMWDQAVLAASLWLLRERLGVRRIWMHTFEGGCRSKRIAWAPPRSPYENVPRSFCFERGTAMPRLMRSRPRSWPSVTGCEFWHLAI